MCFCLLLLFAANLRLAHGESGSVTHDGINVVILGDSMALCGFGKRLDERFRADSNVQAAFTYMACATTPVHWIKDGPYAKAKTRCGYWSIESQGAGKPAKVLEDVYGMTRGHTPAGHDVPKIEDLLANEKPTVLVVQNVNNVFGIFTGRDKVIPARDGPSVRRYITPFIQKLIHTPSPLRKVYWVGAPITGRVSKEVQDFVFQQLRQAVGDTGVTIDSRTLVSYPYHHVEPDKEHFTGPQMDEWADHVFDFIEKDRAAHPLASSKLLNDMTIPAASDAKAIAGNSETPIIVKAKLAFKSEPMKVEALLPYQESLVVFVYDVQRVMQGSYTEKQVLVTHPAHIALKPQSLDKFRIGRSYKLRLHPLRSTPWNVTKSKDDSGLINLEPYISVEDEKKFPGARH